MKYRQLGRSGLRVSRICLGTMVGFDKDNQQEATRVIHEAVDLGVNFIDTADCYGQAEEVLGEALREGGRRPKVVLATKGAWRTGGGPNDYGASRAHLIQACENSLRKLRTDFIDLYYLHVVDPNTPMDETLRVLDVLIQQGKVRYIGTSKHPVALIMEALALSDRLGLERFVAEQSPYNLLDRRAENDLVWMGLRQGIGITPYAPLAAGMLSGKYGLDGSAKEGGRFAGVKPGASQIFTGAALQAAADLRAIAQAKGISLAEMSLAWLMHQPAVAAPVVGARTVEYLRSAAKACDVTFAPDELARIDEIVPPGGYVSDFYGANVHAPLRTNYKAGTKGGAFIPNNRLS